MDACVVDLLRQLNNDFYRRCASSFSETRQSAWQGWRACLPWLEAACRPADVDGGAANPVGGAAQGELRLLDVACGNGRFEAFLAQELPQVRLRVLAADSCDALMEKAQVPGVRFARFDALAALTQGRAWADALPLGSGGSDAAVSFGFFHHIPSQALRERALRELLGAVRPGGVAAVSLWCFLDDARLAAKAQRARPDALAALAPAARQRCDVDLAAQLEPGDCFLGWQDTPGLWRYCHSFSEGEVDRLAAAVADVAEVAARFRSDGKSGRLNAYLIFRKH